MSLYFSNYKKKKSFPFALFGYAAVLLWIGIAVYLWKMDFSIIAFIKEGPSEDIKSLLGFAVILSSFLIFFLNLGIAVEINSKLKLPLYIMHFLLLFISAATGYFLSSDIFLKLLSYFYLIGCIYFIILTIYLVMQQRKYSRYYSRTIIGISTLPLLPFLYCSIMVLKGQTVVLSSSVYSISNIVLYILLFTMLLYCTVNSFYLNYINRRVF